MRGPKITCKTPEIYYLNLGIQTKTRSNDHGTALIKQVWLVHSLVDLNNPSPYNVFCSRYRL